MAKVLNPSGSQWLSMACTCLQKESLWALAITPFRESQGAAFPGAVHRSSMRLSGCPAPLQTATSLVLGAGVIKGVSEGLWLWSSEGETACPFQPSHKPLGPLPKSMVVLKDSQRKSCPLIIGL